MATRSLSSRTPTTLLSLALGLALAASDARSQPMPIDPRPPPPQLNECLQIVQKGGVKIDLVATATPNSVQLTWQGYPGDYAVTATDDTGFSARVELRESRILKGGRNEPAPEPQLEQGTVMHAGARADFAYHYLISGTLYDGRVACGDVSARTPPAPPIRGFARQPSGPLATAQDMKIFGTAITEFPIPILLPAPPGSYQASCVNISQLQVRRLGSPWTMTTISAQCRKRDGTLIAARLNDPHICGGDIWNDDGALGCQRAQSVVAGRVMFPLPAGSWLQSCRDAYHHFESHEFRAQCRTGSGAWRYTSMNLTAFPCASVSNDDGWMSCDASPLPRGPWRAHCKEASIPQPGLGFTAICRRASDGVWQRTSVGQCGQDVDVLDGFLTCGLITGMPGGDWSTRCRPVNWNPAEPAITLICRNNNQTQVAWRVTLASCASPVQLNYDGANHFTC